MGGWRKINEERVWKIIINKVVYWDQGRDKGITNFLWTQRLGLLAEIPMASAMCKRRDRTI